MMQTPYPGPEPWGAVETGIALVVGLVLLFVGWQWTRKRGGK